MVRYLDMNVPELFCNAKIGLMISIMQPLMQSCVVYKHVIIWSLYLLKGPFAVTFRTYRIIQTLQPSNRPLFP